MDNIKLFLAVSCGMFSLIVSEVHIKTLRSQTIGPSFLCGSSETLVCTTDPLVPSMTWKIDNILAAECIGLDCSSNTMFSPDYNFTFNVQSGEFYLIKHTVVLSDNGTVFTCQDGSTSASEVANVKVANDCENYENVSRVDNSSTSIHVEYKVTTGCLQQASADSVRFKWFYRNLTSGATRLFYENLPSEKITGIKNEGDCLYNSNCRVSGFTNKSSVIVITDDIDGETYSFEVEYDCEGKTVNVKFDTAVRIKAPVTTSARSGEKEKKSSPDDALIVVLVILVVFLLAQLCIVSYFQFKIHVIRKEADDEYAECPKRILIIATGSVPIIGFISIYYSWKAFKAVVYEV